MLGQPISMLIPQVVGFRLTGELPEGATATDLVLTVTQMLRERGVVGKFVEFFGAGPAEPAARRPRDDRQHVARVRRDLRHLPGRRRDAPLPRVHRPPDGAASRWSRPTRSEQGLFHDEDAEEADLLRHARARPRRRSSRASPARKRPQDRVALSTPPRSFHAALADIDRRRRRRARTGQDEAAAESFPASDPPTSNGGGRGAASRGRRGASGASGRRGRARPSDLDHGAVVIAAITSCTNTSNPSVMLGAGLLAKKAVERGLRAQAVGEDVASRRARRS